MDKEELKRRLIEDNIPHTFYSLDGGLPNEAYCLGQNGEDVWEVYYSERGQQTSLKFFADEVSACNYFYEWMIDSLKTLELLD